MRTAQQGHRDGLRKADAFLNHSCPALFAEVSITITILNYERHECELCLRSLIGCNNDLIYRQIYCQIRQNGPQSAINFNHVFCYLVDVVQKSAGGRS